MPEEDQYEYDVCLSFAGEQRFFVEDVAARLTENGLSVFYDGYQQANLWGKDLYEHLDEVYRRKAKYCILFISADYARKVWTNHERKSAQARAVQENREYILPARFDDTELPGIRPTVGYIDVRNITPTQFARIAFEKVTFAGRNRDEADESPTDGLPTGVPQTIEEQELLVKNCPPGWEYLLFGGVLVQGKAKLQDKRRDHRLRYARVTQRISDLSDAATYLEDSMATASRIAQNITKVLDPVAQEWAFGDPGSPGNPDNIIHLGNRFIRAFEDMFDWAAQIRGTSTSPHLERAYELAAQFMDNPIAEVEEFIDHFAESLHGVPDRLSRGESIELSITLELTIDEKVSLEYSKALSKALKVIRRERRNI